jgi:hypothetical protein
MDERWESDGTYKVMAPREKTLWRVFFVMLWFGTGVLVPLVFQFFDYFLDVMDDFVGVLGRGLEFS